MTGEIFSYKFSALKDSRGSRMDDSDPYDPLLDDTDDKSSHKDGSRIPSRVRHRFFILGGGLLLVSILTLIIGGVNTAIISSVANRTLKMTDEVTSMQAATTKNSPYRPSGESTGDEFGHCGKSIHEARELGCIFDPMSWAWQRPECYHADLVNDFLERMDWHFWLSNETLPSEEVPREEWERGDYTLLWGPRMWHQFHCTYSWRKFHDAFRNGMPMDNDILKPEHTLHCDSVFLHDYDPKISVPCDHLESGCHTTELHAGFNRCGWS
ncbi:uncharacterized protein N7483_011266 [Penicillium malachiteum]|uniref:uncharacterized protein n=1 Tax=Penicillium malachiteum TaxID=1324776 RepID=UPI002547D972|nr:uncharacterized protein N7483_011266 [Penicillium malachiteum]KAJ5714085.1 hypothetical protein N7483_011266 [Penicillium malachiteum]